MSETRIVFFQVNETRLKIQKIVETARSHFGKKESLLFFVEDEKALLFLDELLWKIPETSFLPHGAFDLPTSERIAITKTKTNVNGSHYAFNLCSTPLLLSGFKIVYDFEDLTTQPKKNLSELRFQAYKQAHLPIESR